MWSETQMEAARAHWAAVKLASGGGVRQGVNWVWACMSMSRRQVLIAARSGMPVGLIAALSGRSGEDIARWLVIDMRLAGLEPMKAVIEAVTERVPMWRERRQPHLVETFDDVEIA
ncbi:MAG: hypothetical protein SV862_00305 [Pseudomonadota bacterium]|nr:hypothetical protein [Pseudomonadota bacterium]